jgi:hypothetical protein
MHSSGTCTIAYVTNWPGNWRIRRSTLGSLASSRALHPGYGATPVAAHEMVALVIRAVAWPVVVLLDAHGEPVTLPKAAITSFSTAPCDRV